ncbi:hypothetical protein PISMIDRAFT_236173 [Pisolithus microcarpus 441]|uniref:Uncharacterized protein n=1 Tax=Pisolithus microcarpus 441 TaxID=765257 RepID=A0A0C9XX54_9AGAM|nr:hypothetical protein PISMIDRAFT_236173 [Pisolithus microcarpus 441]
MSSGDRGPRLQPDIPTGIRSTDIAPMLNGSWSALVRTPFAQAAFGIVARHSTCESPLTLSTSMIYPSRRCRRREEKRPSPSVLMPTTMVHLRCCSTPSPLLYKLVIDVSLPAAR